MNLYRVTLKWPTGEKAIYVVAATDGDAATKAAALVQMDASMRQAVIDEVDPAHCPWLTYTAWEHAKAGHWDTELEAIPEYCDGWHRNAAAIEQRFFEES